MQGIYSIRNIQTGRIYVGQTINFEARKIGHLSALRLGKHRNKWLQADFDHFGESTFEFEMLEETDNLDEREIYWINKQDNPYNKNSYRPKSRMKEMPAILRRIHRKGLDQAKGV